MNNTSIKLAFMPPLLIAACLTAGLYGALHNQISYTVGPVFFTEFIFELFGLHWRHFGDRFGASYVGFVSSWWMGIVIGIVLIPTGLIIPSWKHYVPGVLKSFLVAAATALCVGLIALSFAFIVVQPETAREISRFGETISDPVGFLRAGAMHNYSYIGGLLGIFSGVGFLFYEKRRVGRSSINKQLKKTYAAKQEKQKDTEADDQRTDFPPIYFGKLHSPFYIYAKGLDWSDETLLHFWDCDHLTKQQGDYDVSKPYLFITQNDQWIHMADGHRGPMWQHPKRDKLIEQLAHQSIELLVTYASDNDDGFAVKYYRYSRLKRELNVEDKPGSGGKVRKLFGMPMPAESIALEKPNAMDKIYTMAKSVGINTNYLALEIRVYSG